MQQEKLRKMCDALNILARLAILDGGTRQE